MMVAGAGRCKLFCGLPPFYSLYLVSMSGGIFERICRRSRYCGIFDYNSSKLSSSTARNMSISPQQELKIYAFASCTFPNASFEYT